MIDLSTFNQAKKKERRKADAWLEQIANWFYALFSSIGAWMKLTTLLTGFIVLMVIYFWDGTEPVTQAEIITAIQYLMKVTATVSLMVILLIDFPRRIRDIFSERASRKIAAKGQKKQVDDIMARSELTKAKTEESKT